MTKLIIVEKKKGRNRVQLFQQSFSGKFSVRVMALAPISDRDR